MNNNISILLSSLITLFSSSINPNEAEYYGRKLSSVIFKNRVLLACNYVNSEEEKDAVNNIIVYLTNALGYFDSYNRPKSTSEGLWFYDGGIFRMHSYFKGHPVKESLIRKRVRERLRQALKLAKIYGF